MRARNLLVPSLLFVLVVGASRPSSAQNFIGSFCFAFEGMEDTFRFAVTEYPGGIFGVQARWRAGSAYQFMGSGSASFDTSTPGTILLGFHAAGTTVNFACSFQASLDPGTLGGPASFYCPSTGFTFDGTLVFQPNCGGASTTEPGVNAMGIP